MQTELNPDCLTLKEAPKKKNHIDQECWINTLTDDHADTLERDMKAHNAKQLAREGIVESVYNKTVEEFKQSGAAINVMEKVLKKFYIKARLYDIDSNLFYKQDPVEFDSRRVVTFNGLVLKFPFLHIKSEPKVIEEQGIA